MKAHTGTRLFAAAAFLAAAAALTAFALSGRAPQGRGTKLPRGYLSEVKRLTIESARVEGAGADATLVVSVRNNSGVAVKSFTLSVGDLHVGQDGELAAEGPAAVIEPHGTTTLAIRVSNFVDDQPLVISEASYADGTEEGREEIRRWTREDRARAGAERDAEKGGVKP